MLTFFFSFNFKMRLPLGLIAYEKILPTMSASSGEELMGPMAMNGENIAPTRAPYAMRNGRVGGVVNGSVIIIAAKNMSGV